MTRPRLLLRCEADGRVTRLHSAGGVEREWHDPLAALAWMEESLKAHAGTEARWAGYLGYDLGRWFEQLPARAADDTNLPLFAFAFEGTDGDRSAPVERDLSRPSSHAPLTSSFTQDAYLRAVRRAIDYIEAGDIFQVNLSQRLTVGLREDPRVIYRRLVERAPAWYGGYLDFGDHALLCNSPELFLHVTPGPDARRTVVTRPIKGTRPRRPGMDAELRDSIKDQAELNMIVDLERNDLGRVCRIGSVRVTEPRVIEAHPTVYHGAATVRGVLRDGVSFVDLLRATFPGGSITGAPKIRAMQIIDELEPVRRGPYCGAIGHLSASGVIQLNIAIRTMVVENGRVHIPVGGGIVADSDPQLEYEETLVKAQAMLTALEVES